MDWNRAKNILIAMFLIINIFLSYQLYTISRNQYIYIDEEALANIKQHLNKKNIQLETEIPDKVFIAPSIRVKYYEFDVKKLEDIFFDSTEYKLTNKGQSFEMKNGDLSVEIKDGIYVTYRNQAVRIKQEDVDEKKSINNAYSFVNKLKINTDNQFIKEKEVEKGYIRLVLGQAYKNTSIDSSQIEIIANEEGVVSANISWLEWIKPEKRYNIITPVMALLTAYGDRREKDEAVVIKQIRQGYYFAPSAKADESDDFVAEGIISPMWVIEAENAEIYVNAYNEKIEKTR